MDIYDKAAYPMEKANTFINLGAAHRLQGNESGRNDFREKLKAAVSDYHAALEILTRDRHPILWAGAKLNLGNALANFAGRTNDTKLFGQSSIAYQAALKVFTRKDHPVNWAETQVSIAATEFARTEHDSSADPRAALDAALEAVDDALSIYDPAHMSYNHAKASRMREIILADIAALPPE